MENSKGILGGFQDWMTPDRSLAFSAIGNSLLNLGRGTNAANPAMTALLDRQSRSQRQRALEESGMLDRFTPDQRALLAQMEPGAAQSLIAQTLFAPPAAPPEFRIEKLADGRSYYVDPTGQMPPRLVNPDLDVPNEGWAPLPASRVDAMGLDPSKRWQVGLGGVNEGKIQEIGGSGQTINVGGEAQTEWEKRTTESMVKLSDTIRDDARAARSALNSLDVMEQTMADPDFYSGFGAEALQTVKKAARILGYDAEGIDSMEAFNSAAKAAALDAMGGSLGAGFSDADRDFVLDQVPQLPNTPEGNAMIIKIQRAIQQRKIEMDKLRRDYIKEHGQLDEGYFDITDQYNAENPVFGPGFFQSGPQSGPQVGDIEDGYEFLGGDPSDPNNWRKVK